MSTVLTNGHIPKWRFQQISWGGTAPWYKSWDSETLESMYDHLKNCSACRDLEMSATGKMSVFYCDPLMANFMINLKKNQNSIELSNGESSE